MFIRTRSYNRLINAAEIVEVELGERCFAVLRNGDRAEVHRHDINRLEYDGMLLPARPGDVALVGHVEDGAAVVYEYPIVGWKMETDRYASPILPGDDLGDNQV